MLVFKDDVPRLGVGCKPTAQQTNGGNKVAYYRWKFGDYHVRNGLV